MAKEAIVISTVIGKRKHYVTGLTQAANGEQLVKGMVTKAELARAFDSVAEAEQLKGIIRNPFSHPYEVETVPVADKQKSPSAETLL